jgi:c-di-GMP phosphodiesterase
MVERADRNSVSVSIGRQPIFDQQRKLWGYELFCVATEEEGRGAPAEGSVASHIQSSAYLSLRQITEAGKHVMVDFTEKSILDDLPYVLPPKLATVRVFEDVGATEALLDSLARLKADGYLVAVEGFAGAMDREALYQLADIISMEVDFSHRDNVSAQLDAARQSTALLLAMRVQDDTQFRNCRELGFSLFHGPFFKSPQQITVRKLSSNEIVRFNLLQSIHSDEFDVARLAETIQSDVTISLRLLAYLNSAAFAVSHKVKTVSQAINLLGSRNVKNWLRVVLLSDINQSKDTHDLVLLSAQRGVFLELVVKEHDFWGFNPESIHLLGLFSLLDALLGISMHAIVANLPLEHKMKAALCRESNNEYLPFLELAQCFEEARWEDGELWVRQLNLDSRKVRRAFQTSLNWAADMGLSLQVKS